MATNPNLPASVPEFYLDDSVAQEDRLVMESLQRFMQDAPDLAEESLSTYRENASSVGNIIKFMDANPEHGMRILKAWHIMFENQIDFDLSFDPATEAEIDNDPFFRKAYDNFQATKDPVERDRFRHRKFVIFMKRARDAA